MTEMMKTIMEKIAIVTDTNSNITQEEGKELGVYVLPMPYFVNGEINYEGTGLTHKELYEKMYAGADVSTSMPSPGDVMDIWNKALEENDVVVHIPMSSGLSASYEAASQLANDEYGEKVLVVDSKRASVALRQLIFDAVTIKKAGETAVRMKEILEETWNNQSVYLSLDTLKFMKKGGRVSAPKAALASVLNIRPVLKLQDEKADMVGKARSMKAAKMKMIEAVKSDMEKYFSDAYDKLILMGTHTGSEEDGNGWLDELVENFPQFKREDILIRSFPISMACHAGPGSYGLAIAKKLIL